MSKQFVLNVSETNEAGRLEVFEGGDHLVRFEYSNHFYGMCTLSACLKLEYGDLSIREDTLQLEGHELKRGSYQGLSQSATRFLTSVVNRNSATLKKELREPELKKSETGLRLSIMPSILWFDKK